MKKCQTRPVETSRPPVHECRRFKGRKGGVLEKQFRVCSLSLPFPACLSCPLSMFHTHIIIAEVMPSHTHGIKQPMPCRPAKCPCHVFSPNPTHFKCPCMSCQMHKCQMAQCHANMLVGGIFIVLREGEVEREWCVDREVGEGTPPRQAGSANVCPVLPHHHCRHKKQALHNV